jgi:hypothetical protein
MLEDTGVKQSNGLYLCRITREYPRKEASHRRGIGEIGNLRFCIALGKFNHLV